LPNHPRKPVEGFTYACERPELSFDIKTVSAAPECYACWVYMLAAANLGYAKVLRPHMPDQNLRMWVRRTGFLHGYFERANVDPETLQRVTVSQ